MQKSGCGVLQAKGPPGALRLARYSFGRYKKLEMEAMSKQYRRPGSNRSMSQTGHERCSLWVRPARAGMH